LSRSEHHYASSNGRPSTSRFTTHAAIRTWRPAFWASRLGLSTVTSKGKRAKTTPRTSRKPRQSPPPRPLPSSNNHNQIVAADDPDGHPGHLRNPRLQGFVLK